MTTEISICKSETPFKELNSLCQNERYREMAFCKDIADAEKLYNNAKFYYVAGQLSGALVSYSCSAVLLNSILRSLNSLQEKPPSINDAIKNASELLNCCLQAVEVIQPKVLQQKSSGREDEEVQDWEKICVKIRPLVFTKGSSDCLFFSGVAGLTREKKLFKTSLIYPLVYPNLYPKASKGILLYGPPGTGKTYIVKAAVNQLQATDPTIRVVFFTPSPGELKGKYVGETEKRIEEIFTCASRAACENEIGCTDKKKYQAIIFMDEFDAIAQDRSEDPTGLAANSVNTLLQMMDGIKSRPNVAVIAATNFPWNLDSAILRRFDTQILIDLPNSSDIKELLDIEMKNTIKFKPPNKFSYCETEKTKQAKQTKETSTLTCDFECEEKKPEDLSTIEPYNKVIIDYYNDKEFINGLVQYMYEKKFSNSDVARFMKASLTYSGELSVKSNLFYKAALLGDLKDDIYISSLTIQKNSSTLFEQTKNILQNFLDNKVGSNTNIYQVEKPDILRIEYNNWYYYNVKSLLWKDNKILVNHPQITDIYIKLHEKTQNISQITEDEYKENILGISKVVEDVDVGFGITEENVSETNVPVDIIISFDFYIKQTSNANSKAYILPVSTELIEMVFNPIYYTAKKCYDTINDLNNVKVKQQPQVQGVENLGDEWFKSNYGDVGDVSTELDAIKNSNGVFFDIDQNLKTLKFRQFIKILQDDYAVNIDTKTNNNFTFKYTNFDLYNYLLLYYIIKKGERIPETEMQPVTETMTEEEGQKGGAQVELVDLINESDDMQKFIELYVNSLSIQGQIYIQKLDESVIKNLELKNIEYIGDSVYMQGKEVIQSILFNSETNTLFLKIEQFKNYMNRFFEFNKNLNLFKNKILSSRIIDDFFIVIDSKLFSIIFRNVFVEGQLLRACGLTNFPERNKEQEFNDSRQRLIQILVNDLLKFYILSNQIKLIQPTFDSNSVQKYVMDTIKKMITETSITSEGNTDISVYLLQELICERVYNNANFVDTDTQEIKGGSDIDENILELTENPDDNIVLKGGKKKFRLTTKKNSKEKQIAKGSKKNSKSAKNKSKRVYQKEKEYLTDKLIIQHGGALDYEGLIKFCKEQVGTNYSNIKETILHKNIYVATQFDYSAITKNFLHKDTILNNNFYGLYNLFSTNPKPEEVEKDLQSKNQYLPLIFKKIEGIGFIVEQTPQQPLTKDDKDIGIPKMKWNSLNKEGNYFGTFLMSLLGLGESKIASLFCTIAGTGLTTGLFSAATSMTTGNLPDIMQLINSISITNPYAITYLSLLVLANTYSLVTSKQVTKETILNDITLITIFNLITEIKQIETLDLNTDPIEIFSDQLDNTINGLSWWTKTKMSITTEKKSILSGIVETEIKKYEEKLKTIDPNIKQKLTNLNIPIQAFAYASTLVKSTYVKETGEQLKLYEKDRDKLLADIKKKKEKR